MTRLYVRNHTIRYLCGCLILGGLLSTPAAGGEILAYNTEAYRADYDLAIPSPHPQAMNPTSGTVVSSSQRKPTLSELDGGFAKGERSVGNGGNAPPPQVEPYSQQGDEADEKSRRRRRWQRFKKRGGVDEDKPTPEKKRRDGRNGKSKKVDIKTLNETREETADSANDPEIEDTAPSSRQNNDRYGEVAPDPAFVTRDGAASPPSPYVAGEPPAPPTRQEVEDYRIRLENRLLERYNNIPEHAGNVAKVTVVLSKPLQEALDGSRIRAEFDQLVYDPWGKRIPELEKEYYVVVFGSGGAQQVRSDPSIRVGLDLEKTYSERAPLAADPFRNVQESDAFHPASETPMPDWWRPEP